MEDKALLDDTTILVQETQNTSPNTLTRRIVNRLRFLSQSSGTVTNTNNYRIRFSLVTVRSSVLTMAKTKTRKSRRTPREREAKQVITCLRRRLAWLTHHNEQPCDAFEEQYSELPRALSS